MKEFLSILFVLLLISCKQGNNPEIENLLKLEENIFC